MNYNKDTYHKRSTYDELVIETITKPTAMIELPDRLATQLRNDPRLTCFDDEEFFNLDADCKKIQSERMKQQTLRTTVSNNTYNTNNTNNDNSNSNNTSNDYTTHTVQQIIESAPDLNAPMPQQVPDPQNPPDNPKIYANAQNQTN